MIFAYATEKRVRSQQHKTAVVTFEHMQQVFNTTKQKRISAITTTKPTHMQVMYFRSA